jgi:hypothetical protein
MNVPIKLILMLPSPILLPSTSHAGGTAAAASEEEALTCPSASPHLSVMGVRNPVAVRDLARYGAERADSVVRAISSCRESHVRRAF